MISGGEEALAGRGMERSSLQAGMQGGMRSQYMEAMIQARAKLVEQERQKQWEHLLQALSGTSSMTSSLAGAAYHPPPEAPDDEGLWGDIAQVLPFLLL